MWRRNVIRVRATVTILFAFCLFCLSGVYCFGADPEKINPNSASQAEFYALPGMTETLAKAIVAYRRNGGRFDKLTDLLKVPGMTKEYMDSISSSIEILPEEDEVKLPRY
jgi:competence ComEA-like helix-hairpin-helix protein